MILNVWSTWTSKVYTTEKLTAGTRKCPPNAKPTNFGVPAVSVQGPGFMFFSQSYCLLANKNLNFKHVFSQAGQVNMQRFPGT